MTAREFSEDDTGRQESWYCTCPMCGGVVRANPGTQGALWIYTCEQSCGGGMELWTQLQDTYGCSGQELWHGPQTSPQCGWWQGRPQSDLPPEPLPPPYQFALWREARRRRPDLLAWLAERGLEGAAERWHWGYGRPNPQRPSGLIIPCPPHLRRPTTFRVRYWPELWRSVTRAPEGTRIKVVKYAQPAGHPLQLWPAMPKGGKVILTEGELDTALAIRHHVRAVSSPGMWVKGELLAELGRSVDSVVVVFDVGAKAEKAADRAVERIRDAGAEAWSVRLPMPEVDDDLGHWFCKYGHSVEELWQHINQQEK